LKEIEQLEDLGVGRRLLLIRI